MYFARIVLEPDGTTFERDILVNRKFMVITEYNYPETFWQTTVDDNCVPFTVYCKIGYTPK
jgi:hypothetical protein